MDDMVFFRLSIVVVAVTAGAMLLSTLVSAEMAPADVYDVVDIALATPLAGCHIKYTAIVYHVPSGKFRQESAAKDGLTDLNRGDGRYGR